MVSLVLQGALCLLAGCAETTASRSSVGPDQTATVFSRPCKEIAVSRSSSVFLPAASYEIQNGGSLHGPPVVGPRGDIEEDLTTDDVDFESVAQPVDLALKPKGLTRAAEPSAARLLVKVFFGTILVPADAAPFVKRDYSRLPNQDGSGGLDSEYQSARSKYHPMERIDTANAAILGYTDALSTASPNTPATDALMAELEQQRYYVVLLLYDKQQTESAGKRELLWETRVSMGAARHDEVKAISAVAQIAAENLGIDSHGLKHQVTDAGQLDK
jgi:hypothetical protein